MLRSFALFGVITVCAGSFAGSRLAQMHVVAPAPTAALAPVATSSVSPARAELVSDGYGHYHAAVEIDGHQVPMIVDTGASYVSLTNEDAGALGIVPFPSDYTIKTQTANGVGTAARTVLHHVRIGAVTVDDVDALVLPESALHQSLLGMSFLKRLNGFEMKAGHLVLTR